MWSCLTDSDLGRAARKTYESDPARKYHNWDHIQRLYHHAEHVFGFEYDPSLDAAILAHDVIYDALPDKEIRSADWLANHGVTDPDARAHILKTIEHWPSADNRMVLLDLYELRLEDRRKTNFELIFEEAKLLYGVDDAEFFQRNADFMSQLAQRVTTFPDDMPDQDKPHFIAIAEGISSAVGLANDRLVAISRDSN